MIKALVLLSGGMDSATLLAEAIAAGRECITLGFSYGAKHNQWENEAAFAVANHYVVHYAKCDLDTLAIFLISNLLKGGDDIPEGHYEDASMAQTVVPGRNMIFASIGAGVAWSNGAQELYMGIHSGDHAIYPDCRPAFFHQMRGAVAEGTDHRITLCAPFLSIDKGQIVKRGLAIGVPYELTRTCYKEQPIACGKCGSCQERLAAFKANDVEDPIEYESREILPRA